MYINSRVPQGIRFLLLSLTIWVNVGLITPREPGQLHSEVIPDQFLTSGKWPSPAIGLRAEKDSNMEIVLENTAIPERDLLDLAIRLQRAPADLPRVVRTEPVPRQIGDQEAFWISDQSMADYFQATATLRYVNSHVYMWVENGYNVSEEALLLSAERFASRTYPRTRQFFGSEWSPGIDGDPRIHIYNGYVPGVGGYYSSADQFSRLVNPYSNEREMVYINLNNASPGTDYYDGILAHEFQHMIHWHNDRNEETWVNEGLSELSAYLNGFDTSGAVGTFARQPDTQLTSWADSPGQAGAHYGAAYSFMYYLLQRFGEDFIRDFVADKENGLKSLEQVLAARGVHLTANDVFADWVIANYLGDPHVAPDGRFGHRVAAIPMVHDVTHEAYPVERATEVRQYGADYVELKGHGDLLVTFEGSSQVKLTANEPYSGSHQWWSNRGDDSNMTLTRRFDLSGLESATLEFWVWYDIERHWDYAYVEVSVDGGQTWDILHGTHGTDHNPNGTAFGWGYTGVSGGGESPAWVQERVDLSPYTGQAILLRFEYVTDDAVNRPGLCLDDIAIPELGYYDDVESDGGGWQAQGFVRSNNTLPQRFLLQLIEFGPEVRVRRLGDVYPAREIHFARDSHRPEHVDLARAPMIEDCEPYAVQPEDSLWKLAERFFGTGSAADLLLMATNAKHEQDPTYTQITDARQIKPGWKLCIPTDEKTRQALLATATAPDPTPASEVRSPQVGMTVDSQQFIITGLGKDIERAVLVVSGVAPVTTEVAPYRYTITPLQAVES